MKIIPLPYKFVFTFHKKGISHLKKEFCDTPYLKCDKVNEKQINFTVNEH